MRPALLMFLLVGFSTPADAENPVPVLLVHDPERLASLEGLGLAERLTGVATQRTVAIRAGAGYEDVVTTLERDLAQIARSDERAGVGIRYAHRLFDRRWLRSEQTHFELVGVVNRLDRQPFSDQACGELRLVYRLAYTSAAGLRSRLPMTINLVYWQRGESCAAVAARWLPPTAQRHELSWLRGASGPLSEDRLHRSQLKSLEVNLQSVRWPATVHPSLGGHAEYILRVFAPEGEGLRPSPLENTPDVARLRRSPRLRAALLAWLKEPAQLEALEAGTFRIPARFLAKRSVSVTPRGLARLANRPFAQLFRPADFTQLPLEGRSHIGSPAALIRRLDGRSCAGCHQSRSIAGFHFPGEDPLKQGVDALAVGRSPHLIADEARRRRFVDATLAGRTPQSQRGIAERSVPEGRFGVHCGLGDPGFAHWTCAEGFTCQRVDETDVGICLPRAGPVVGSPCETGTLRTRRKGSDDRLVDRQRHACGPEQICEATSVGFPGGMCASRCGSNDPDSVCGAIALLTPFNRCIARGTPFPECLQTTTRPGGLRRCDAQHPCRDDYLCTRVGNGSGGCIPPYFLFQMRVDGH